MQKKYQISPFTIYISASSIILGIGLAIYKGITFNYIYNKISNLLVSSTACFGGLAVLVCLAICHAIVASLKSNIDFNKKKSVLDLQIWLNSIFSAIGTGFVVYTSLKIFNGLLGEKVANVQFLLNKDEGLVLWPFMAITLVCVGYCSIKIGGMFSEIITLCKTLMDKK